MRWRGGTTRRRNAPGIRDKIPPVAHRRNTCARAKATASTSTMLAVTRRSAPATTRRSCPDTATSPRSGENIFVVRTARSRRRASTSTPGITRETSSTSPPTSATDRGEQRDPLRPYLADEVFMTGTPPRSPSSGTTTSSGRPITLELQRHTSTRCAARANDGPLVEHSRLRREGVELSTGLRDSRFLAVRRRRDEELVLECCARAAVAGPRSTGARAFARAGRRPVAAAVARAPPPAPLCTSPVGPATRRSSRP